MGRAERYQVSLARSHPSQMRTFADGRARTVMQRKATKDKAARERDGRLARLAGIERSDQLPIKGVS